jgi:U3 small nucleolar RNA-associated protein 25
MPATDPFETHFAAPDEGQLSKRVQAASEGKWRSIKKELPDGSRVVYHIPDIEGNDGNFPPAVRSTSNLKVRSYP